MAQGIRVTGLDHLVLNVGDVERSLQFYLDELGLEPVRLAEWRAGRVPFPSVRIDPGTILDLLGTDRTGVNTDHFCLVVEATDFDALKESNRFDVVDGPARRFGARGEGVSLYVRDPDGNTVELRYYP
jgi:catechol 2,3-dioxygenase-like lactoylglutathione lyase family enzyme